LKKKLASFVYTAVLFSLFILSGCRNEPSHPQPPPPGVTITTIKKETIPATFEYVGVVQSSHLIEIRARVEGYLDEIAYEEGSLVHEGSLLFKIDPKTFEATLAQAKGFAAEKEAALWDARQTVSRLKPLYENNAASKRDLDNATAQELGAKAALESAQAQVLQAEINLGYTTIHSPINGLTGQAKFRQGALVGPGPNSLLTTVMTMNPIWVNFNVSSGDILKYQREGKAGLLVFPENLNFDVEVVLADGTILPTKGKVDFADPSLNASTGSMMVRAVLPNPNHVLMPGQFVRARITGATHPDAIVVPQAAVMQGSGGLFVYVVNKENKVEIRQVETGDWYQSNWIIDSGLQPGERVIIDGINKVMPGSTVTVKS